MNPNSHSTNVLVLLSGGIDSSTCVEYYKKKHYKVSALFIDYNQPNAAKERAAAQDIANHYDVPLLRVTLSNSKVPEGYVPARNALLLSVALMSMECDSGIVAIGIHAGTPYVDCSLDFQRRMQNVYDLYTNGSVRIDAPFIQWTKSDIWDYAQMQNVPLNLTYSNNLSDLHPVSQTLRSTL